VESRPLPCERGDGFATIPELPGRTPHGEVRPLSGQFGPAYEIEKIVQPLDAAWVVNACGGADGTGAPMSGRMITRMQAACLMWLCSKGVLLGRDGLS
jgi:hypothetical protein